MSDDPLYERAKALAGRNAGGPNRGKDPVNVPMIRHWCEAVGDRNPAYLDEETAKRSVHGGLVAPPTMLQVWTMRGLEQQYMEPSPDDAQQQLLGILREAGYSSVVATNCEQTYHRYLRPGDHVTSQQVIEDVSPRKRTALGEGYFVTSKTSYTVGDELVAEMRFRILLFKPAARGDAARAGEEQKPKRPQPVASQDTAFFWEGAKAGELRIQRCASCGKLRHPPGPACPGCRSFDWDHVTSSGRGTLYSFVVHHYPPVPGFEPPFVVALVELEEGTRLVSNLVEVAPEDVVIGMPLQVVFEKVDDELVLPLFRPRE